MSMAYLWQINMKKITEEIAGIGGKYLSSKVRNNTAKFQIEELTNSPIIVIPNCFKWTTYYMDRAVERKFGPEGNFKANPKKNGSLKMYF